MNCSSNQPNSRRGFLKASGAALISGAIASPFILPSQARAQPSADTLKVGLVGCGGRGSGAAKQALQADPNTVLTAAGDAFADRLEGSLQTMTNDASVGRRVKVDPGHRFVGLDAYQKVIDSGVDLVILATPPGFRPVHLKAAVAAGKHVFCEKPMAVDAPGVRSVLQSAEEARKKNLAMVAGFCWRYNVAERAGVERIHEGMIGEVRAIYGTYLTGALWSKPREPGWTDLEWQLRNWLYFTWLSGDHITEQCVHTIDKMAWIMQNRPPLRAVGLGGRGVRTEEQYGHIYDHFGVVYEYPNDARGFIFCRQQPNCFNHNSDVILGTKGTAHILGFGGPPRIATEQTRWRYSGPRPDMYQVEHNELFASIRAGKPVNDGVWMAHSTMLAIMGRMVAYTGRSLTWEEALDSQENLTPPNLAWDQPLPVPPVPKPGITKFS